MKIQEPGLTLYKLHSKYNSHSNYPICECGFINNFYINKEDVKQFPVENLVSLGLYGPKAFQALIFGILAADSPEKFSEVKDRLKDIPILEQAEKDVEINREIGDLFKNNEFRFKLKMSCDANGEFHKTTYLYRREDRNVVATDWDLQPTIECYYSPISIEKKSGILGDVFISNICYKYYKLKRMGIKTGWGVAFKALRIHPDAYSLLTNIKRRIYAYKTNSDNQKTGWR